MKILVTGASGFIGGRFARFALEQGLTVRVNGRRPEAVQHLTKRGAEFVQGDLSDPDLVQLRARLAQKNATAAAGVQILYGGSMKPENAKELMAMPDIDGGLIGGAALKAADFLAIIHAAD